MVTLSNKSMLVVEHEAIAETIGEQLFRSKTEDYYMGCLGSEVISQAPIGNMSFVDENPEENLTNAVYMDCEVSFTNGKSFSAQRMKFNTGACMTGVPNSVNSEFTLQRGLDEFYIGSKHLQECCDPRGSPLASSNAVLDLWAMMMMCTRISSAQWIPRSLRRC